MTNVAARVTATVSIVLFWTGVAVAGRTAAGYSARDDVISSLAGRGSSVAMLGILSILVLVPAHLAAAWVVRQAHDSGITAWLLGAAAAATALIGLFRVSCPSGAAGCGQQSAAGDAVDLVHGLAVTAYAVVIVAAMVAVAVRALRGTACWPRWLAFVSAAAAVGSVLLLVRTGGADPGQWQRLWVGTNLGWLLLVTWLAPVRTRAPAGAPTPHR